MSLAPDKPTAVLNEPDGFEGTAVSKNGTALIDSYQTVLVTGGLGFIGRYLVTELLSLGKNVKVLDVAPGARAFHSSGAHLEQVDLRRSTSLAEAVEGAELVFHLAGNASGTTSIIDPRFDFETNALGSFNLAEALLLAGVRRVVYLSTASVYGRPRSVPMSEEHPTRPFLPYGASKLAGELLFLTLQRTLDLPVVVGRAFTVYGPGEDPQRAGGEVSRFVRWHLNRQPIQAVGDLDRKTRDFVHVRDLITGLLLLADRGTVGDVYNLGSGKEVSLRALVTVIGAVTGRTAAVNGIDEVGDDTYRLVADIAKVKALGYRSQMSLVGGIAELVQALGDRPELPGGETIFRRGQRAEGV